MSFELAPWDVVSRLWLIARARLGLRRRRSLHESSSRSLDWLFRASAGNLAVAHAYLPPAVRAESRLAYLICRALDAAEDLSPDSEIRNQQIGLLVRYLGGHTEERPGAARLIAHDERSRIDVQIVEALPEIREALGRLPRCAHARVQELSARLALAMTATTRRSARMSRANGDSYGNSVLGEAVLFAVSRVADGAKPPDEACRATGRLLQRANDIRDAERDWHGGTAPQKDYLSALRRKKLLEVIPDLPLALRLLRWLRFPRFSGARSAAALMAVTTAAFLLKNLGLRLAASLRWPSLLALCCCFSQHHYEKLLNALELLLCTAVVDLGAVAGKTNAASPHRPLTAAKSTPMLRDFEQHLACSHPGLYQSDCFAAAATLFRAADQLNDDLPEAPMRSPLSSERRARLLVSDFFLLAGAGWIARCGTGEVVHLGRWMAEVSKRLYTREHDGTEIVSFLSAALGRAHGLPAAEAALLLHGHLAIARALTAPARAKRAITEVGRYVETTTAFVHTSLASDLSAARRIVARWRA